MLKDDEIQRLLESYAPPQGQERELLLKNLDDAGFVSEAKTIALIGVGGTISSSYSPTLETIVPGKTKPAEHVMEDIQKWEINRDSFSAFDVIAKDSRDLVVDDIKSILDVIACIRNERILVTSGTYLLPKVAEALYRTMCQTDKKAIAVTGSALPLGFLGSEASINIMSAITLMNFIGSKMEQQGCKVFACYHGKVFQNLEELRAMDLHPKVAEEKLVYYPNLTLPVS